MVKQHNAKLTEAEKAVRDAMQSTAREVLKVAKQLAPVDSGALRKSGKVFVDDTMVGVKFTGPQAWLQHERLDYQHPHGGQAKFLEAAVEQVGVEQSIISGARARLQSG